LTFPKATRGDHRLICRHVAAIQLADELGLSRSQLIDEALALFLKAVVEVRRGRRLVTVDPSSAAPACEIATPTLAALEWALQYEKIDQRAKVRARRFRSGRHRAWATRWTASIVQRAVIARHDNERSFWPPSGP
jgi:hypothetical protein